MSPACFRAGRLLQRRASGLDAVEGLRLEEHLAGCTSCRAQANLLQGLSQLCAAEPFRLTVDARQRAIAGALAAHSSNVTRQPVARSSRAYWLLSAAAAGIALAVFVARYASAPSARVLSGEVQASGAQLTAGAALHERTDLHSEHGAVVAVAHAQVELRARSDARWDGATRTLVLERGSVLIEVDPAKHESFSVDTRAFHVEVLGTRFEVSEHAVHVQRGRVSVKPADQPEIILAANSNRIHFELQPPVATNAPHSASTGPLAADNDPLAATNDRRAASAEPRAANRDPRERGANPDPHSASTEQHAADNDPRSGTDDPRAAKGERSSATAEAKRERRRVATEPPATRRGLPLTAAPQHSATSEPPSTEDSAGTLLTQARAQLAARDLEQARRTLARAAPKLRDDAQRAEALSLEAESELLQQRYAAARDTYLRVARKFPKLPAAETALFAAARIEAEQGQPTRAAQLLDSYLTRYPDGTFQTEAQRRLTKLRAEPAQ